MIFKKSKISTIIDRHQTLVINIQQIDPAIVCKSLKVRKLNIAYATPADTSSQYIIEFFLRISGELYSLTGW